MSSDILVVGAEPGSRATFGPYSWQPHGMHIQNRSNVTLYCNDGPYCDNQNYSFIVPPYYQGGFPTANKQLSVCFDINGAVGPIPQNENAVIVITDSDVTPGLFPFAQTVRQGLNSLHLPFGQTVATGTAIQASVDMAPGLYEIYAWYISVTENGGIPGFTGTVQAFLTHTTASIDVLCSVDTGGLTDYSSGVGANWRLPTRPHFEPFLPPIVLEVPASGHFVVSTSNIPNAGNTTTLFLQTQIYYAPILF